MQLKLENKTLSMGSDSPNWTRKTPNNFGALRLLFATLVILSHSPELIDGNRSREILSRIFGTLSFGELGVDGFFLISGFLITKSFQESLSAMRFFLRRVLRIYPGYVVAYLLCVFALAPLVGGHVGDLSAFDEFLRIISLRMPQVQGVFDGTPYPFLNGSMWTIAYEFRCYMLVLTVGVIGLLATPSIVAFLTVCALILSIAHLNIQSFIPESLSALFGDPVVALRFIGVFGCGALYYLYRDFVRYDMRLAIPAAVGFLILLFSPIFAEVGLAVLGGYVLFWFALNVKWPLVATIGRNVDISYGVYLYAWPVQKTLIWWNPSISPWLLFLEATLISALLGFASWLMVEKPFLALKTEWTR
jgi:peptidoglycan/LPS O-acetylase OafA/YrhL